MTSPLEEVSSFEIPQIPKLIGLYKSVKKKFPAQFNFEIRLERYVQCMKSPQKESHFLLPRKAHVKWGGKLASLVLLLFELLLNSDFQAPRD